MCATRLTERYKVHKLESASALVAFARQLLPTGSVYHLLGHVPEQGEDIYTILVDDHTVVGFDVARASGEICPGTGWVRSLEEYKRQIGKGKNRLRLERATEAARIADRRL